MTLQSRDHDAYLHVWEGQCITRSDAQVMAGRWEVKEFDDAGMGTPMFGADWGFSVDPTAVVRAFVHNQSLWVSHEAFGRGVELLDLPAMFERIPDIRQHRIQQRENGSLFRRRNQSQSPKSTGVIIRGFQMCWKRNG